MIVYKEVESSTISAIGYENKELHIKFKNGTEYVYYDVPAEVYEALNSAESVGKYFAANIKNNYKYAKI